jgi:Na+/serine symporter
VRLVPVYVLLSAVGLVGTWWFNLSSATAGEDYLGGWFASAASSSAAVDILVTGLAAAILMVVEGRRLGWRPWVLVLLVLGSFAIAVAFVLPLFLACREVTLARRTVHLAPTTGAP